MSEITILLLGPESCGKTLLLKSLQYYFQNNRCVWDFGSIPKHGQPTVGVEIATFSFPCLPADSKKGKRTATKQRSVTITVKELGGQMAPLWPKYLEDGNCKGLIYCIDSSNPFQASRAIVELARILNNAKLRETARNILIIFTKSVDFEAEAGGGNADNVEVPVSSPNADARMSISELRNMMLFDDVLDEFRPFFHEIDVFMECSAVSGVGVRNIFAWLERFGVPV